MKNSKQKELAEKGYVIIEDVFSDSEIDTILTAIRNAVTGKATFRKSKDLFAIRQFFNEVPDSFEPVFLESLYQLFSLFSIKATLS